MKTILALAGVLCAPCLSLAAQVTVGSEVLLPASQRPAHDPCVAFGGDKYLVVWQSGRAEKADLYACRLDASGGVMDATPFVVSNAIECQEKPRAAWGTDSWLVVWADLRNDKDYDVYAARITAAGQVLDSTGIALGVGSGNQCQPDVAFDGQNWLVVWRHFVAGSYVLRGSRVSTGGQILDASPIVIADIPGAGVSIGEPHVVAIAGKWLVFWNTRKMWPVGIPPNGAGFYTSVVSAGGAVTRVATSESVSNWNITAATNGSECLVSWFNGGTGSRSGPQNGRSYGALRVGSAGQSLGTTDLGGQFVQIQQPAAVWDGKGYMVVCWEGYPPKPSIGRVDPINRIVAHLVAADGTYGGAVVVASGVPNPVHKPSATGGGTGNTLVVYERHPDVAGSTILIAARLLKR